MNIFKRLFGCQNNNDSSQVQPPTPPDPLPDLSVGLSLDIITDDGEKLLSGRISNKAGTTLTLERLPGQLSFNICPVGSTVYARGYNRRMQSFNMNAVVDESTRTEFRIKNVKVEEIPNHRSSFRVPVNCAASLYRDDDERLSRPEPCVLVDLSTGGACIESEYVHAEEEVVFLRFKLDDYPTMTFKGQIIRGLEHKDDRYRYGILFAQLTQDELTNLTRTMYNIQTGNRQIWDRNDLGTWG